jgi:DNA-binding Xre family transcriptional regulator
MSDSNIGSVKSVLDVDVRSGEASLQRAGEAYARLGDAATHAGQKVEESGGKVDRTAALQQKAIERARSAWERELLIQNRAADQQKVTARAQEMAALKADILSRSLEKQAAAEAMVAKAAAEQAASQTMAAKAGELLKGSLAFAGIGLGLEAGAGIFKELVLHTMETGVQLGKLHQQTGISTESLSVLKYAAASTGIEFETLTKGFKKLAVTTYDAENGSKTAVKGFAQLGISVEQLRAQGNDMYAVLALVADKFREMPDGIEKSDTAAKIFGARMGSELIPLLNQGSGALEEFKSKAPIFTDADIEKMEKMHKSLESLSASWSKMGLTITDKVAPALSWWFDKIASGDSPMTTFEKYLAAQVVALGQLGGVFPNASLDLSRHYVPKPPPGAYGSSTAPGGGGAGSGGAGGDSDNGAIKLNLAELYNQQIAAQTKNSDDLAAFYAKLDAIAAAWKPSDFAQVMSDTTERQIAPESAWILDIPPQLKELPPAIGGTRSALDELTRSFTDHAAMMHDLAIKSVNDFNETAVGKMFGDKGASWSKMFSDIGHQAAKGGLQQIEGLALGALGFGKHDGSSAQSPLYVVDVSGAPGTAVPGAGGLMGKFGNWLGGAMHLPGFAEGGEVPSNLPIMVGENGPEPFIPRSAGTIIPNHRIFGGGGHTWNIDARGTDPSLTRANFERALQMTHRQAVSDAARATHEMMLRRPR